VRGSDPGSSDGFAHLRDPFSGDDHLDPLAVISWNYLMTLVAVSGDGQPPIEPGEFDPFQSLTPGQCSFATPQYCASNQPFYLFTTELLDDDPSAPPKFRFFWQTGALYDVTDATGDLSGYAGGTVHVIGLERARGGVTAYGVPLVLFPAGATLEPAAPFAVATPASPEAPRFGLAYATAPEPSTPALGVAVWALLSLLRSRTTRRTAQRR
jgi:hypothetical protein